MQAYDVVLQMPGNAADAAPCERLQKFDHYYFDDVYVMYKDEASAESCVLPSVSLDYSINIPHLTYQTLIGELDLWADLEFVGLENGDMIWRLLDAGAR